MKPKDISYYTWIKKDVKVDYHEFIDGKVTKPGLTVTSEGPIEMCGGFCVMVDGIRGVVSCDALSPSTEVEVVG